MKQGIVIGNRSRHGFNLKSIVDIIGEHGDFYRCKGEGIAQYFVGKDEIKIKKR